MKIDGEYLNNLRFADDVFLCTVISQMLQELSDESRQMGLKMKISKTKVMVVDNTPINEKKVVIENVEGYVYLREHYSLKEKNALQRYNEESWQAGWQKPNAGISSKATMPCA